MKSRAILDLLTVWEGRWGFWNGVFPGGHRWGFVLAAELMSLFFGFGSWIDLCFWLNWLSFFVVLFCLLLSLFIMSVLLDVNRDLLRGVDLVYKRGVFRFFKEEVDFIGVRTPVVRKIASKYWRDVRDLEKTEVWRICEGLFLQGSYEEGTVAIAFVRKMEKRWSLEDFDLFEKWLFEYISNWAHDDDFCTHVLGSAIVRWPELVVRVKGWVESESIWVRRAAAVSFIYPYTKPKKYLREIFWVAKKLMNAVEKLPVSLKKRVMDNS